MAEKMSERKFLRKVFKKILNIIQFFLYFELRIFHEIFFFTIQPPNFLLLIFFFDYVTLKSYKFYFQKRPSFETDKN